MNDTPNKELDITSHIDMMASSAALCVYLLAEREPKTCDFLALEFRQKMDQLLSNMIDVKPLKQ